MSPSPLRERHAARVLLFDQNDRVLLIRGREPGNPATFWFTPGGGLDPGEDDLDGARRELREETGLTEVDFGPLVWVRAFDGLLHTGEMVAFRERYFVARCAGGEVSRDGWEPHEIELMDEMRWWSLEEISASTDTIYPEGFAALAVEIAAGRYPDPPLQLSKSA